VMERLRQAWQGLVGKKFSDKALQKEMDLLENLIYLTHRKMPVGSPPDDAIAHAEQISPEERQLKVTELVHEQVKSIMIALHMENDPQYVGSASRVDHSFDVRESSMAGAGMGVFLRGNVRAGSVIMFYPGHVYLPHVISRRSDFPQLNDPEFRLAITGDSLIDPYNIVHECHAAASSASCQELQQVDAALIVKNRLALGHMVNHAGGSGKSPNVVSCAYQFPSQVPAELRYLIPNSLVLPINERKEGVLTKMLFTLSNEAYQSYQHSKLMQESEIIPTQVLISKSDIPDGSEILLDYRLNPKKKKYWPSWYTPVDVDAAKRRWAYF